MSVAPNRLPAEEIRLASRPLGDGSYRTELSIPGIHCGGCVARIERAFTALPGVEQARVNLSTRRASVAWRATEPPAFGDTLDELGFEGHLQDDEPARADAAYGRLVRALAVAGFATMNIMGLSVAIWSGASPATRDLFHWLSAAIALPTLVYSGRIFFASAWQALKRGRTNMDVPISIGVLLAFGMSLYDTIHQQAHAYFDASVSLLFFLLIGRTLDHLMRDRARTAVTGLRRLAAYGATVIGKDGNRNYVPLEDIEPGMAISLAAGDRIPVDAVVIEGRSQIDAALATGESMPLDAGPGSPLRAGTLNLSGPLMIRATAAAGDSFLAEMVRLMEAAEGGRSAYRRIADRASRLYAPVVHTAAALAFVGWFLATGDWHLALGIAVAVLIITCPCALGLAVPMVQVVAARRLFERGIMIKDGSALERLVEADSVLFDKTGTLTLGRARLANRAAIDSADLAVAAALGTHSRHPHSQSLAKTGNHPEMRFEGITEQPGLGVEGKYSGAVWRLGRADWALANGAGYEGTVLSREGQPVAVFEFEDDLRPEAVEACTDLKRLGLSLEIVSGDRSAPVTAVARMVGASLAQAAMMPGNKVARVQELQAAGNRVLMVGDGLNDAPALAAAHVSIAPASAADIGRQAADVVFLHESLAAVPFALRTARSADRLIRQNFAFSLAYNLVAAPLALAGMLTPLIAALAMSGSSLIVVANALRLAEGRPGKVQAKGLAPKSRAMPA